MKRMASLSAMTLLIVISAAALGARSTAAQLTIPAAPDGLTATAASSNTIWLAWTDNSDNEERFKIEMCQGSGCTDFVVAGYISAGGTNASVSNLAKNKTYTFRVRASNGAGDSDYSNVAWATTLR